MHGRRSKKKEGKEGKGLAAGFLKRQALRDRSAVKTREKKKKKKSSSLRFSDHRPIK